MQNRKVDKRQYQRYQTYCAAEIETGDPYVHVGVTSNISRSGASLMTTAELEEGAGVQIRIAFGDFEQAQWCPARVVRTEEADDARRLWPKKVSFAFLSTLPEAIESQLRQK